jgi:mRNA-degrading endonuclease YafQ of YafQ-DinJ toxin-antitoxin module
MSKYESRFQKDIAELLKIGMKLYEIDEQYKEVIMFLRQFAVIPDHLRYHLISGSLK